MVQVKKNRQRGETGPMKRTLNRKDKKSLFSEGGSLLYVIFFVTLLSVLACGYMVVTRYHITAALKNRSYMEARLTARMIHNSFCEAVRLGESEALGLLMDEFENDSLEQEESTMEPDMENADPEEYDTDMDLEEKEYITEGEGSYTDENGTLCNVRIRLKAYPVQGSAFVDTWTQIGGFSMHLESQVPLEDIP